MRALRVQPEGAADEYPRGMTLVELLIAAAISMVVMGALAGLFGLFGRAVKRSETTMNLGGLMRSAAWQLRQDLAGVTSPLTPWLSPETGEGYFELVEGPARDATYALDGQGQPTDNLTADTDDILLFTTQSLAGAFVGRYDGQAIESPYAEVAWFCRPAATQSVPGTVLHDLHRRQLLVMNYLGRATLVNNALPASTDRATCDISLRSGTIAGQGNVLLPNGLGDLTKREFRFMRGGLSFPHAFPIVSSTVQTGGGAMILQLAPPGASLEGTARASEDVILTNVVGFDVRVFDPKAAVTADGRTPGDPGYVAPTSGDALGAYVDLGWGGGTPGLRTEAFPPAGKTAFQSAGVAVTDSPRRTSLAAPTYDTWSRHYEFNGIDDDGDGVVDEAVQGVAGTAADPYPKDTIDAETSPPYPVPLRGLEVRIRCYEPSSRQVRQVTIRHSFAK